MTAFTSHVCGAYVRIRDVPVQDEGKPCRLERRPVLTILPYCHDQETLWRFMPWGAEPGVWDWGFCRFVSLAQVDAAAAFVAREQARPRYRLPDAGLYEAARRRSEAILREREAELARAEGHSCGKTEATAAKYGIEIEETP